VASLVYKSCDFDSGESARSDETKSRMLSLKKLLYELGIDYANNRSVHLLRVRIAITVHCTHYTT